jgi:LPS-assembly protein
MKNSFLFILFLIFYASNVFSENLLIEAKNISLDKNTEISIFENNVTIKTEDNNTIKSDYVEYNKKKGFLRLKKNIVARDSQNNIIKTDYAEYYEKDKIFKSKGPTIITTSENYIINGEDITFDNKKKFINSKKSSTLRDKDRNKIYLENFEYQITGNIFKSIGFVKIEDQTGNIYEFSQIYIDTKKKEILGTDIKAFLNNQDLKFNNKNKPRVYANTMKLNKDKNLFNKSIFTICDYRKNDKCPPWSIQATEMLHDNKKKTIYYDNAVIKVFNIPIFYFPKLSHPDPTVNRRSGFLPPTLTDSKNLGSALSIPYFFAINNDKNFTLTNKLFVKENPLFLGEYHQAFKDSNLYADIGFTEGYKKTSAIKKSGNKSHFFSKFIKNFGGENDSKNSLSISVQEVSNDKYLKLYKIDSSLVDYNTDTLENTFKFTHDDGDTFFGLNASVYETLKDNYNDKYEYILPEVTFSKNIFNDEKIGNLGLQTNMKIHNYDTNKFTNFIVNDFNWSSKDIYFNSGISTKILSNFKNINYEAKNVEKYKKDTTNEIHTSLGLLSELNLRKDQGNSKHFLNPKLLLRFSPGSMRKEESGSRLDPIKAFSMNRLDNINNFETGYTGTLGLNYKIKQNNKDFDFSIAQIINEKENKKMASKTSLDEKVSDLVGAVNLTLNDNINLNYNFSLDQNYNDLNYNDIGTNINFGPLNFDFNYLQEKKHIGDQDYFKTKIDLKNNDNGLFSFETKRNLITNSAEFYNLSYEYLNDCLRAGLVYRREFYNDSELEPENSLMFKITLTPFGNINSPTFSQ